MTGRWRPADSDPTRALGMRVVCDHVLLEIGNHIEDKHLVGTCQIATREVSVQCVAVADGNPGPGIGSDRRYNKCGQHCGGSDQGFHVGLRFGVNDLLAGDLKERSFCRHADSIARSAVKCPERVSDTFRKKLKSIVMFEKAKRYG